MPYIVVGIFMCLIQQRSLMEMCLGVSHLWFLMTIFECYMAGYLLEQVFWYNEKRKLALTAFCCIIVVLTVHWNLPTRILTIERFVHYFPLYLIGMLLGSVCIEKYMRWHKEVLALFSIALIILPIQHIFFHKPIVDQFIGLLVILPFFILCHSFNFAYPSKWVASLDKHSMSIYVIHQILQQEMNKLKEFHNLMINYVYLYPICQFVFLIVVSWSISYVAHKSKYAKYVIG